MTRRTPTQRPQRPPAQEAAWRRLVAHLLAPRPEPTPVPADDGNLDRPAQEIAS